MDKSEIKKKFDDIVYEIGTYKGLLPEYTDTVQLNGETIAHVAQFPGFGFQITTRDIEEVSIEELVHMVQKSLPPAIDE